MQKNEIKMRCHSAVTPYDNDYMKIASSQPKYFHKQFFTIPAAIKLLSTSQPI